MDYVKRECSAEREEIGVSELTEQKPRPIRAGYGHCSKCPCLQYEDAGAGNSYCNCGHSYTDHWLT